MNQPLDQIMTLDVYEAMMLVKSYSKISNPKDKKKSPIN